MNSVTLYCLDVEIQRSHRKYYLYFQIMVRRQAMKMNGFDNYFLRQKFDPKKPLHFRKDVLYISY